MSNDLRQLWENVIAQTYPNNLALVSTLNTLDNIKANETDVEQIKQQLMELNEALQQQITTKQLTIASEDGSGNLTFGSHADSKIIGVTKGGISTEMIRVGGDSSNPLIVIGDGIYNAKIGTTTVNGGANIQLTVPSERVLLENVGGSGHSANFRPRSNGQCMLGTGNQRWNTIFAATATVSTSDAREKNNITPIADYPSLYSDGNLFEILFSRLIPMTYYLNLENENPQLHIGFIAQDITQILAELGIDESELGLLNHTMWVDDDTGEIHDIYGLRYEEFIALNTHMIQKLLQTNNDLQERLSRIEAQLNIQ